MATRACGIVEYYGKRNGQEMTIKTEECFEQEGDAIDFFAMWGRMETRVANQCRQNKWENSFKGFQCQSSKLLYMDPPKKI